MGVRGHSIQNSSGSGRAGRPYGWMLLLFIAFGALIFGMMALHRHREKRIFDLVVKDKNLQLHSLHLHLQKERDFAKVAKRKSEELKSELYTLRNQKSELGGKILEMQSTISSLKEEHKAIESALEEKQNEINLLKEREKHINEQNIYGSFLAKALSLKEAEFGDLKSNLELPIKDWDINFKYPNSPVNLTTRVGIVRRAGTVSTNKENSGRLHNYIKITDGEKSANGEDGRETENVAVSGKVSGEPNSLKSSQQGFQHKNTTNENHGEQISNKISKDDGGLKLDTKKGMTNGTEAGANSTVDFKTPKAADGGTLATNTKFEANSVVDFEKRKNGATLAANTKFGKNGQEKHVDGSIRGKRFFSNEREGKQKERPREAKLLKFFKEGHHSSSVLKSNVNDENRTSERFSQAVDEVQVNKNINDKESRVTSDDNQKKPKGIVHPHAKANGNPIRTDRSGNDKATNPKKEIKSDRNADFADWEFTDTYE